MIYIDDDGHVVVCGGEHFIKAINEALQDFKNAAVVNYNRFDPPKDDEFFNGFNSYKHGGLTFHVKPMPDALKIETHIPIVYKKPTADSYDGVNLGSVFLVDEIGQCQLPPDYAPSKELVKSVRYHQTKLRIEQRVDLEKGLRESWKRINELIEEQTKYDTTN